MATKLHDTRTARFRDLIEQLADERGRKYGWKTAVAELLDIDSSYLNKLDAREAAVVTESTTDAACRKLGLRPAYFTQKKAAKYRDFLAIPDFPDLDNLSPLAEAMVLSERWSAGPPEPRDARRFARKIEAWAAAEISALEKLKRDAEEIALGSDSAAPKAAVALHERVWLGYGRELD